MPQPQRVGPLGQTAPCPIVVYIHGGAGKLLSPHDDDFNGEHLARRHGVCYIALSYRLGALGFLAHPALSAEDEDAADVEAGSGNYAMLDLLAGLRWVQAHGASFGGTSTTSQSGVCPQVRSSSVLCSCVRLPPGSSIAR